MHRTSALVLLLLAFLFCLTARADSSFQPGEIPVVYLNLDGGQEAIDRMNESDDHSVRCTGTVDITVPAGYGGGDLNGLALEYIRGRGNTTWSAPKKPYKLKFSKKQNLFGMGADKHWVLLANYYDNSLLRNRAALWLGEQLGLPFNPQGVPVDVVMNGTYLGSYCLCEQVRVSKSRVNIQELTADVTEAPDISGGYLLSLNIDEDAPGNSFTTAHEVEFTNVNPAFDPLDDDAYENPQQRDYIRSWVQSVEDGIFAEDGRDGQGRLYTDLLDADSLADFWWIQEMSASQDGLCTSSNYLYKDRDGKLCFGPLWDFDLSFGNDLYRGQVGWTGFNHARMAWTDELRQHPDFVQRLLDRWPDIEALLLEFTRSGGILDQWAEELRSSWVQDHALWGTYVPEEDGEGTEPPPDRSFDEEIALLRNWIDQRRIWISSNLDLISRVFVTVTTRGEGIETQTRKEYLFESIYVPFYREAQREGYRLEGWFLEDGSAAPDNLTVDRDLVLTARFRRYPDPGRYEDVAVLEDSFSFTKVWDGRDRGRIDFTLYRLGGEVYERDFSVTGGGKEQRYSVLFPEPLACYVIEAPVRGYQTVYENVGVYAGITDRCCNGGRIINREVPRTGDRAPLAWWAGLALVSAAALWAAVRCFRRRR